MVEPRTILLIAALDGMAIGRDAPEAGRHPLHRLWIKREEIKPPVVPDFVAAKGDTAGRVQTARDLARVHRAVEYRGPKEDGEVNAT